MLRIICDAADYHQSQQDTNNLAAAGWVNVWQLNFMTYCFVVVMLFQLVFKLIQSCIFKQDSN